MRIFSNFIIFMFALMSFYTILMTYKSCKEQLQAITRAFNLSPGWGANTKIKKKYIFTSDNGKSSLFVPLPPLPRYMNYYIFVHRSF